MGNEAGGREGYEEIELTEEDEAALDKAWEAMRKDSMYAKTARFYDAIYSFKDYEREAEYLQGIFGPNAKSLLDVACGTGKHLEVFCRRYDCEGVDNEATFVEIAQQRNPGASIHKGDFRAFDLGRKFDVVTCLFSAIGYAVNESGLNDAIRAMANHLNAGGVLLIEPWLFPENFKERHVASLFVDEPEFKIARVNNSRVENGVSIFDMHHIVGTPEEVVSFVETHALTLFSDTQYRAAYKRAGLDVEFDPQGPTGRGLYIGRR